MSHFFFSAIPAELFAPHISVRTGKPTATTVNSDNDTIQGEYSMGEKYWRNVTIIRFVAVVYSLLAITAIRWYNENKTEDFQMENWLIILQTVASIVIPIAAILIPQMVSIHRLDKHLGFDKHDASLKNQLDKKIGDSELSISSQLGVGDKSISSQLGVGDKSISSQLGVNDKSITAQLGVEMYEKSLTLQHKDIEQKIDNIHAVLTGDVTSATNKLKKLSKRQKEIRNKLSDMTDLIADWERLIEENARLSDENDRLREENAQLTEQLSEHDESEDYEPEM